MTEFTYFGGTAASETLNATEGGSYIIGQGGNDRLIGSAVNDVLVSGEYLVLESSTGTLPDYLGDWLDGGNGDDQLNGGSGADFLIGGSGRNILNGGGGLGGTTAFDGGFDTAIYAGARDDYTVAMINGLPAGVTTIAGSGLSDSLTSIERLSFSDGAIAFDIDGNAGNMYRLYRAAFDRQPDDAGLGYWISIADKNVSSTFIAASMMDSDEFRALYGTNLTNEEFLTNVYDNVLHRPYDQGGFDYWIGVMQNQHVSRADVLNLIAQDTENRAAVIGEIKNGIDYTLYTA